MNPDAELKQFLSISPLHQKIEINHYHFNLLRPDTFKGLGLKFKCKNENDYHTFKIDYAEDSIANKLPGSYPSYKLVDGKIQTSCTISGVCQSCGKERITILLRIESDEIDDIGTPTVYKITKLGQYPPYEIKLEKVLQKYLSREDQKLYSNSRMLLSNGQGIGAFSYLRRIVENNIKELLRKATISIDSDVQKINEIIERHESMSNMTALIDELNQFLPPSLKEVGFNPFREIYSMTSNGLHNLTDEECVSQSQAIDKLMIFIISRVSEYQNEIKDIKSVLGKNKK